MRNQARRLSAWAILEQKADTIFVLTTNYIDGMTKKGDPVAVMEAYKKMFVDIYGRNPRKWPTINVVVLKHGDSDPKWVLDKRFGPIWRGTNGDGSIIEDITNFMNEEEQQLYRKYKSENGNKSQSN